MNVRELSALIDRSGHYRTNGLLVKVRIVDVRTRYGAADYRIEPTSGKGRIWVRSDSVALIDLAG